MHMIPEYASIAIQTSLNACRYGAPFGGTFGWMLVVIMSNDSGAYPWAPIQTAVVGFPITILCDVALLIPALFIRHLGFC